MRLTDHQAALLALCRVKGLSWYLLAREAQRPGGIERLLRGDLSETGREATDAAELLPAALERLDDLVAEAVDAVEPGLASGADLITCLDGDARYPVTLRQIYNLPPFLFVRGTLVPDDLLSVAVVGTRRASDEGLVRANRLAHLLTERGVTVVSGLAAGIDSAAHRGAIESGGRTIAVIGTGILRCYPKENAALADTIAQTGAVVSQFWPTSPPATYTFPRRNVTMSGIAQGTVVVEASETSGAKMQARFALEHGKKLFLLRSLVDAYPWAMKYLDRPGAVPVDDVEDVVRHLSDPERVAAADQRRVQLSLEFA